MDATLHSGDWNARNLRSIFQIYLSFEVYLHSPYQIWKNFDTVQVWSHRPQHKDAVSFRNVKQFKGDFAAKMKQRVDAAKICELFNSVIGSIKLYDFQILTTAI